MTKGKDMPLKPEDFNKYILEFRSTKIGDQYEKD